MDILRVLFTAEAEDELLQELYGFCELEFAGWKVERQILPEEELIEKLQGKDVLITSYDRVTRKVIEGCPELKLIVCARSNPVNVDLSAAKEWGITVTYTPGRNSDATAEFAVAILLNILRHIPEANRAILDGRAITDEAPHEKKTDVTWGKVKECHPYTQFQGPQIHGKTAGIVGYGSIGRRVAAILKGFGANLLIYDPYMSKVEVDGPGVKLVEFEELLEKADFISSHIKVTEETKGLFNREAFSKMKPGAYFINNSRGAIVVEEDLIEALRTHRIAGAALDVFEYEPLYKGHPFVTGELDNLLVTPHISGACPDAIANGTILLVEEVRRFAQGKRLLYKK